MTAIYSSAWVIYVTIIVHKHSFAGVCIVDALEVLPKPNAPKSSKFKVKHQILSNIDNMITGILQLKFI